MKSPCAVGLSHVWSGAFLSGAFLVISVHAYFLFKNKHIDASIKALKIAFTVATLVSLTQLFTGHRSADGVAKNQPAKLAALEGHYQKNAAADLYILGWVNQKEQKVFGLKIPGGLSFLLHQDSKRPVVGLNAFNENERPKQVNTIFQFYHLMVAIGMALIALSIFGLWWVFKIPNWKPKWWLALLTLSVFLPQIANQAGWFAAEMGRQPWVVYGLLRTSDALSQAVSTQQVWFSLILFTLIYIVLFALFIYLLNKKIKHGIDHTEDLQTRPKQDTMSNWQNL